MSFPRYKKEMHATHHHAKHPGYGDSLLMHPVTAVASYPNVSTGQQTLSEIIRVGISISN